MATSPYMITGDLNFGGVPSANDIAGNYSQSYANALSLNQQNYANILAGYQGLMSGQISAEQAIAQGYAGLSSATLQDIAGVGASQAQAIADTYAQQSGQAAQSLVSRGLGNTTVANSVQRGLTLDEQKAQIALANQMAQLTAGYRSQLGLAGLNQANQANMQNTALGSRQLDWMNSVNAPYPNAAQYYALLAAQGARRGALNGGTGGGQVIMPQKQQGTGIMRPPPPLGRDQGNGGGGYGGGPAAPRSPYSAAGEDSVGGGAGALGDVYQEAIAANKPINWGTQNVSDTFSTAPELTYDTGPTGDFSPDVYGGVGGLGDYMSGGQEGGGNGGAAWWQQMGLSPSEAVDYGSYGSSGGDFGGPDQGYNYTPPADFGQDYNSYADSYDYSE